VKDAIRLIGACGLLLASAASRASADDFSSEDWAGMSSFQEALTEQASPHHYKWDLGLDASYTSYLKSSDQSALVDVDKVTELNEERADLGLGPVAAGSQDTIVGHPRSYWEFGLHVYRQVGPIVSIGVIGGFGLERTMTLLDQGTAIAAPMYTIDFTRQIYYAAPSIKVGYWINRFRPYVLGGVGWYSIRERTQAKLVFDPFSDASVGGPFTTSDTTNTYSGLHLGTGIDVHVGGNGTIGLEVRYHRIYKPGENITLISPGLRFSYLY
jgi:opacity protein-like surface antigen